MTPQDLYTESMYGLGPDNNPFGRVVVPYGNNKYALSFKDAAVIEWNTAEAILRKVLASTGQKKTPKQIQAQPQGLIEGQTQREEQSSRARAQSVPAFYGS